jgi:hypothetical protein
VRLIVSIALLVLGLGILSCAWDEPMTHRAGSVRDVRWVRTADGWERDGSWETNEFRPPSLHPLVWAAGQGLLSLLGLAALPSSPLKGQ